MNGLRNRRSSASSLDPSPGGSLCLDAIGWDRTDCSTLCEPALNRKTLKRTNAQRRPSISSSLILAGISSLSTFLTKSHLNETCAILLFFFCFLASPQYVRGLDLQLQAKEKPWCTKLSSDSFHWVFFEVSNKFLQRYWKGVHVWENR